MIHKLSVKTIKLLIFSTTLFTIAWLYLHYTYQKVNKKEFENTIQVARTIAATFKVTDINELQLNLSDTAKHAYNDIKNTLIKVIQANPDARFAYIFTERNKKIYFVADSESPSSKDYSPPGQEYTEAHHEDYQIFKDGKESSTGPVTDRWGTWMNVLVPIKNKATGKTIAAFGLDFNAHTWSRALIYEVAESSILLILLFISLLFSYRIRLKNFLLKEEYSSRKKAENALQITEYQQKSLVENIATGIVVHLPDTSIYYSNPRASDILGLSEDQLRGKTAFEKTWHFIDETGAKLSLSDYPINKVKDHNTILKDYIIGIIRPDIQNPVWAICNGYPTLDSKGDLLEIVMTFNDITQLKESEERLQESERELIESQKASGIGSYSLDIIKDYWTSSITLNNIFGINSSDVHSIGGWLSLVHPTEYQEVYDYFNDVLEKKGRFDKEYRIISKDKSIERWVHGIGMFVFDNQGYPIKMIGTVQDITEQKKFIVALNEAKIKAESSDKLKTAFMNNISHEIRTPLNGILGFGELLASNEHTIEERAEYFRFLKSNCNRLVSTIHDYIDISLIVSGSEEVNKSFFIINKLIEELSIKFQSKCTDKGLVFSLDCPTWIFTESIYSDLNLLIKIFNHLLDNAVKFTYHGKILLGCTKKERNTEFFVKDTGIGIDEDKINQIFDSFTQADSSYTRGHEGNGLGLSIAKGLTLLLDGEIRVESIKNVGSTFFVSIPMNESK